MIFWGGLLIYSIVNMSLTHIYPDNNDYQAVGKFNLIMSNLWAFFPIMQAQGLWLKILLIGTCWYSILWHWTQAEFPMPGSSDLYGTLDTCFSCCIIIAYAISWLPKIKTYKPTPWFSIGVAVVVALWHLFKGKMRPGAGYRLNFIFWVVSGFIFGPVAFVYKSKSDIRDVDRWVYHSTWHVYVFSCAYAFSRAQEYLEIY